MGGDKEEPIAIVAVLDAEDLAGEKGTVPEDVPNSGATVLHEHIRRFRHEIAARYRFDRLIGSGPAMRLARGQVELAAACRSSVLLIGPPGSGRRHLAAAIHYGAFRGKGDSPRFPDATLVPQPTSVDTLGATAGLSSSAGNTVGQANRGTRQFSPDATLATLDCSLLGVDLPEALASAAAKAAALDLESATGTLLLHRVDELPADVQVQLTDLLTKRLSAWRLTATAVEPLVESARRGKFHAELAAMLSTITIELPPLVQRREDIPLLAQLFLEERNAAGTRQIGGFSPAALDRLDAYHWPGNIDELAEVVTEAHRRAAGREIVPGDLPERLRLAAQAAAHPHRVDETIVLDEFLGRVERELIRRALARSKGNKARAARLLGVTRPRLYRRMLQLGLE